MLCIIPMWDKLGLSNNKISFTWKGTKPETCGLHKKWSTTKLHNYWSITWKIFIYLTLNFYHIGHLNKYKYLYLPLFI